MFERFIQTWIPERGDESLGQYLFVFILLLFVTITIYAQFGETLLPTLTEVFMRTIEGFSPQP